MRVFLLLCFSVCTYASVAGAVPFAIENVDVASGEDLGQWASIALDSHDNPHVAYHDATAQDLKYAHKVGPNWVIEVVDSGNLTGWYASIAVDANDAPHIAYYNAEAGFLRYAEKTSGVWVTETVPGLGVYGSWCSIAIDHDGNPVIAYRHDTNDELTVSRKDGAWATLGTSGLVNSGFYTDIAIGPDGFPYVSHGLPSLLLFWVSETGPHNQILDGAANVGLYTSIDVDRNGAVHISYHDETNGNLKYATSDLGAGAFSIETVDIGGIFGTGEWTSIALNESGEPRISYYDGTSFVMKYARRQGVGWAFQIVDQSTHGHGDYTSLALDTQGNPHIVYRDFEDLGLRYASGAVKLTEPTGGETWAVGSVQTASWFGAGAVDVRLSTNGTDFDHPLADDVSANSLQIRVPHAPTRFARVLVERVSPFSSSASDSFFTIDASVILSSLKATLDGEGVVLSWKTQPGPEAEIRYRVQRSEAGGTFASLHAGLLGEGRFVDQAAPAGALYRVSAVNGLGNEIILGDVRALPEIAAGRLLTVTPNPIQSGDAMVLYRAHPGVTVQIQVYDVRGALVRTLYAGRTASDTGWVRWDGTDANGVRAQSGVYFVRLSSPAGLAATERLILVR